MQANMNQRTVVSERRKDARKRPLSLVYVELSAANGGMLRDLSELGFAVRAMMPLHVGEVTAFTFMLDTETKVEGRCTVLWVEEDGRLAGMQFTEVAATQREQVRTWLGKERERAAPPEQPAPTGKAPLAETMEELLEELRTVVPRPETPPRDELPLPELHEERPAPKEEKRKKAAEAAESAREILREVHAAPEVISDQETNKAVEQSPDSGALTEMLHEPDPMPVLEEIVLTSEVNEAKPWQNREVVWLAIRMMIVFAIVAVAVVYHRPVGKAIIWMGQKIAGEEALEIQPVPKSEIQPSGPDASPNPETTKPASTETAETATGPTVDNPSDKASKQSATSSEEKTAEVPPAVGNAAPAGPKSALPPAPVPLPATSKVTTFLPLVTPSPDGGQQEYLAAQDILKNKNTVTGMTEAVKLLWAAVEKGNSNAELALAELYRTGRGVAKNCDQAKILLTAAAKKGNAEAQHQLEEFLVQGCE